MKIKYDKGVDALYIELNKNKVYRTSPRGENVLIDYDKKGGIIGIEILDYSVGASKEDKMNIIVGQKKIPISVL